MTESTANPHRGEVEIELGGKTYVMRPTFQAIVEAETRTGAGLVTLAQRAVRMELTISDIVAIVTAGLRAADEPATPEKVGPMVFEAGLAAVHQPVADYLAQALSGGKPLGEAKAPETKH